jgi:outer membrane lipoprotein SlyB
MKAIWREDPKFTAKIGQNDRERMMISDDDNPALAKNRYIFAGAGAVLTGVAGAAFAGGAGALIGALLGGLLGYNLIKRL